MKLRCCLGDWITNPQTNKLYKTDFDLHVYDENGNIIPKFEIMCEAIYNDIQSAEGSGIDVLTNIQMIEEGVHDLVDPSGNAWVHYITKDKVWFEGFYGQGEGGEVTFEQYKLAVQTYVKFISDLECKTIEVPFPN